MNGQSISAFSAETRDFMEQTELAVLGTIQQGLSFDEGSPVPDEQRYVDAYWEVVHELYPVLHKPTFEIETTSPLLHAAILALGSQVSGDRTDLSNSRALHEKCIKVLKKVAHKPCSRIYTY